MKTMQDRMKIVVGLELSQGGTELTQGSYHALEQARWLVEGQQGEILLAHAKGGERFVERAAGIVQLVHEGVPPEGQAAIEAAVGELTQLGIQARSVILDERPALGLVRLVMSEKADLLVIGRHDVIEDGPRIGRVAAKLLRKCPVPVWVVKPGCQVKPERVLAATDQTATGKLAVLLASDVSRRAGAELHVVHAFQITLEQQFEGEDTTQSLLEQRDALQKEIREELARSTPGTEAKLHVLCTAPEKGILDTIQRVHPDLLVIGTVSRGGIAGFLIGNTAERVLPKTTCSLLVIKPDDFISPVQPANR